MVAEATNPKHLKALDGLRGVAAVVVVISHSANVGFLPGYLGNGFGQMGVTLFYALSAFLLGRLYLQTQPTRVAMRHYAISRISRVLPLFFFVLLVSFVVWMLLGKTFYSIKTASDFTLNALLIRGTSVLWSIPVELHFYVVFAGLWWLRGRYGLGIWPLVAMGLVLQGAAVATMWIYFPDTGTFNLPFWGHIFLFGLVLSQYSFGRLPQGRAWLQAIVIIALLCIALPEVRRVAGAPTLPNFIDPLTAGVPLLVLYLALRGAASLRFLEARMFRFLGGISFGVYLIHMPIIAVLERVNLDSIFPGANFVVVLYLSLFLAWCARHIIELPAQSFLKTKMNTRPATTLAHSH